MADSYFRLRDSKNRFFPASVTLVPLVSKDTSFVQPARWASPASVISVPLLRYSPLPDLFFVGSTRL
jgi:hypothetical protein